MRLRPTPVFFFYLALATLLTTGACNKSDRAKPMPESVSAYVSGYTGGIVSRTSPIRVQFTGMVAAPEAVGQEAPDVLSFRPSVNGKLIWEDRQTLRFDPEPSFEAGTTYIVTVDLGQLYDNLPDDAHSFEFDFRTRDPYYELVVDGLYAPEPQQLQKQALSGVVRTADYSDASAVEKMLDARQNSRELPVRWEHDPQGLEHYFFVESIDRGQEPSSVELSWNGDPIGIDKADEREVEVPALGDFKVMDVRSIGGADPFLSIRFSDPLQAQQNLDGLVTITNATSAFRYIIDGNVLRVYPGQRITGEQQVTVSPGVRNIQDKSLPRTSQWDITFASDEPQVRLVGRGVILPAGQGLLFPFEAIGLNAVEVEIFKIFNNNILQFLQSNALDGNYELQQVGRVIMRKKIDLLQLNPSADAAQWTRYALDLNQLIKQDPQAIYQVRIGFRPAYAVYPCPNKADVVTVAQGNDLSLEDDVYGEQSIMNSWYGIEGYYEGYEWSQRDNPCYPAYYNTDRFVQRNVIASNFGLIAKGGDHKNFLVAVTDLRTAEPISGVTVRFYDYQQQVLTEAQTDGKGLVQLDLERPPFLIVAESGSERGYLRLQDGESLSLSRFDVSGSAPQKGFKGFLYGERGVWRPGDSVYLNFVLEDERGQLPPNYPVTFELLDARGQLQLKRTVAPVGEIYPLYFTTRSDDPTGNWLARVRAGGASFEKTVRIETVRPNRIKIDLDFGQEALFAGNDVPAGVLQANWLHGAPAAGLKAEVEATFRVDESGFQRYANYVFMDPARQIEPSPRKVFEGTTGGDGRARFDVDLPADQLAPGKMTAAFRTRVFEQGGDFSTDYQTYPYYPYVSYAGVSLPASRYGEKRLDVGKPGALNFVAVNADGQPVANRRLTVGLYRVEWRWWWDEGQDNISQYNNSTHFNAMESRELTTNSRGEASWQTQVEQWGRYLVRVCDTESGHCSGDFFYAGQPWYGDDDSYRQEAAMMTFQADKEKYSIGEKVTLTIPTGQAGRALITLETGSGVLSAQWMEAKEGDNTFTFTTTEAMAPTVYAHVTLIQPHGQSDNSLPMRLYGVVPIAVENPATHLEPQVSLPNELKPEASFAVQVSEADGRAMTYTLAVVDEGLLGLTRFNTPNPWDEFYAREALGVRTWDLYDQVLGAYGGQLSRILGIGGDAELIRNPDADRANRFKPVVMHLGPFKLARKQKATHNIKLPNYIGSVRVMVVAVSDQAYGKAEKSVPVRQPLMVLASLPRVLGPGERLTLPVTVFATQQKIRNATVRLEEKSGLVKIEGGASKQVSFAAPGEKLADFSITVGEATGVARFTIVAEGSGERAGEEVEIQIRNPNPQQTRTQSVVLNPGEERSLTYEPFGLRNTRSAILEMANLPPIDLGRRLEYVLQYPYGCLEQTLSGGFPQLYVGRLMELDDKAKARAQENIRATIDRLRQFQTSGGGFAYWPGNDQPDQWVTSYTGHFLLEAQALGYSLPAGMLDNWLRFQRGAARKWSPDLSTYGFVDKRDNELNQAYRLYTLALARQPELGAMNQLREHPNLAGTARWRLAAAYAQAGQPETARNLSSRLETTVADYRQLSYTYGSDTRDQAMILETLVLLDDQQRAGELVLRLSRDLSAQQWLSTQDIGFSLLAIGKYVGNDEVKRNFAFTYQVNGKAAVDAGSDRPLMQIQLPDDRSQPVRIKNTTQQKLFATIIVQGEPLVGEETAQERNLDLNVRFLSENGQPLNVAQLPQGTDFIAEVTVRHPGQLGFAYPEMALRQVFPSGWEIRNARFDALGGPVESPIDYRDYRDDRVYTFFDLGQNQTHTYRIHLTAAYRGRFYLPAFVAEAMYDNSIYASSGGRWVEVGNGQEL